MADRRRGSGDPPEGSPEYNWLYGSDRGSGRGNAPGDPEPTRMLPTTGRPGTDSSRGGGRGTSAPARPAT
ncbi:MAG TPA: LytR family transcriptional regulator, partial [Nocardioidaceae bacterium]|nr:LytR family transcriptional regulator [Nocardioidaceae bacterium]